MERVTHKYLRSSSISHKSLLSGHLCHKRGQCWSRVCSDHRLPAWAVHDIKQLHFCGAGNPTWITSPGKQAVLVPLFWFLCTNLLSFWGTVRAPIQDLLVQHLWTWVGLSQLEFLCVAAIYLITKGVRWKMFIYFRYFQFPYFRPLCRKVPYHLKFRLNCLSSTLPMFLHLGVHSSWDNKCTATKPTRMWTRNMHWTK